ncbi:MAG: PSD1 and planctomycete cytochrome C domain-containing protein [Candidatus Hydrogenedentes bacterium]|nr:PSD1 and planctomycete cytochrome C domain-containing protein [Candidatus Hydrogenedentota bacterium]
MMMRYISIGCVALCGMMVFAEEPAPSNPPTVDAIVELLKKLEADPPSRAEAEKTLKDGLEQIRQQVNESQPPVEAAAAEVDAAAKRAAELDAKLAELSAQIDAVKKDAADHAAAAPGLQEKLDAAKKQHTALADKITMYERALELIGTLQPAPEPAPEQPASAPAAVAALPAVNEADRVNYNRDIRPILSNNCMACHGPDEAERKAELRFDEGTSAYTALSSGKLAIVPGDPAKSELVARITAHDEADRMPPAAFGKTLTQKQIDLLTQWIAQGGSMDKHWAFTAPAPSEAPVIAKADWARNPIDNFIASRLETEGLAPMPEAEKHSLIRRVTLDLTGLPPTLDEVTAFVSDTSTDAYEKVVDRLLASPHYGEQMARHWLDVSRYADTNGYHVDNERYMWRWRDWVIGSFNENQPFDKFTIEQIAGDLLPEPSLDQRIATGFNRNHMITFEGGVIPEEYRVAYVVDRVNTTSTVWMGLTVGCAQCHDHKFDPISMQDFYEFYAFFNSVPEKGSDGNTGNSVPLMKAPLPDQKVALDAAQAEVDAMLANIRQPLPEVDAAQAVWMNEAADKVRARWAVMDPDSVVSSGGATLKEQYDRSILVEGTNPDTDVYEYTVSTELTDITAIRLEALTHDTLPEKGAGRASNSNFVVTEFEVEVAAKSTPEKFDRMPLAAANSDYSQSGFEIAKAIDANPETGWAVDGPTKKEARTAVFVTEKPAGYAGGSIFRIRIKQESKSTQHTLGRFRIALTTDKTMGPTEFGQWYVNGPFVAADGKTAYETAYEPEKGVDIKATYEDQRLKWVLTPTIADGQPNILNGDIAATYLYRTIQAPSARQISFGIGSNDAVKVWVNDQVVLDNNVQRALLADQDTVTAQLVQGENRVLVKVVNYGNQYSFQFRRTDEKVGDIPLDVEQILLAVDNARTDAQRAVLQEYYRSRNWSEWPALQTQLAALNQKKTELDTKVPTTMVMAELEKPRETFMLKRGQYDAPGDTVTPAVLTNLAPMPANAPLTRLGLAQWLVDPSHPLTSRVAVNRYWQRYFGTGLVKTSEDFGVQGDWPSHPQLLDWLSLEFIRTGWDVKALQRLIVTSATYRQSSKSTSDLLGKDPENRLLARGSRYRLDAEEVRDNALAVSGLLVNTIGGPSVKPYQPKGIWEEVSYGDKTFTAQFFEQDNGENLYRRSMYTFWKRQSPPPSMLIFDAPNREVCTARRARTNTPLQALALLNDPQFVEAARVLAQRMMKEVDAGDPAARICYAFQLATARVPNDDECAILTKIFGDQLAVYRANTNAALELLSVGESKRDEMLDPAELAAYTTIASMILNLDETVTKG